MLLGEHKPEDLIFLKELIEAGKLVPIIDKRYVSEAAEAIRISKKDMRKAKSY